MRPDDPKAQIGRVEFGGGLNTRTPETKIHPLECADGKNFDLDIENTVFKRRKPFDLAATATNGEAINGFAQLEKADGTISTLIQAGTIVYEWDGSTTFTQVGTVAAGTKLRGWRHHNFVLNDVVIITDLAQVTPVLQWDGTTLSEMTHNLSNDFFARYCVVESERALYGNVKAGTATPHVIVGSGQSDYDLLSISDRPASATGSDPTAPWFLPMPDLRPINGLTTGLGKKIISTRESNIYELAGTDTSNYQILDLYPGSGAAGNEPMMFIGNDIIYGRRGRLESLFATVSLGDVETDDLSRSIADQVKDILGWRMVYDQRTNRGYFIGDDQKIMWVFHKSFLDERLRSVLQRREAPTVSPWSKWVTTHSMDFNPVTLWTMLRPTDLVPHVYMGGSAGEIFQLEGSSSQDGGSADIAAERLSNVIEGPRLGRVYDVSGHIRYRKMFSGTVTLTFEHGGENVFDQSITITLDAADNIPLWGAAPFYWNEDDYWGATFSKRLTRQNYSAAGQSSQFQVRVATDGAFDFEIESIDYLFREA